MPGHVDFLTHAPTLIGGQAADHGDVRIWAPDRRRLFACVLFWCALWSLWGYGVFYLGTVDIFWLLAAPFVALIGFVRDPILALVRPRCLMTDTNGIALASGNGGTAFDWREIHAVYRVERRCGFALVVAGANRGEINLTGFSEPVQAELFRLIVHSAGLRPVTGKPYLFMAPEHLQASWRVASHADYDKIMEPGLDIAHPAGFVVSSEEQ